MLHLKTADRKEYDKKYNKEYYKKNSEDIKRIFRKKYISLRIRNSIEFLYGL